MNQLDIEIKNIVEAEVDRFLYDDEYYEKLSTPLKSAKALKLEHRQNLIEFLQFKPLRSQLQQATELVVEKLDKQTSISKDEYDQVIYEFNNIGKHYTEFINSIDDTNRDHPIIPKEIFGFSDKTLFHIYSLALTFFGKKDYQNASSLMALLTTLAPYVPSYWIAQGLCFQAIEQHDKALEVFEVAKMLNINSPIPIRHSINSYLALKDSGKAREELEHLKECIINLDAEEKKTWEPIIKNYETIIKK